MCTLPEGFMTSLPNNFYCFISCLLLASLVSCGQRDTDDSQSETLPEERVPPGEALALEREISRLGNAIQTAESSVSLYHRVLRRTPRSKGKVTPRYLQQRAGELNPAQHTALLYLSAIPGSNAVVPHSKPNGPSRGVHLSHQIRALCDTLPAFQQRLRDAFGGTRVEAICPNMETPKGVNITEAQIPNLVYQALTGRTATQRKNLLALASNDTPTAIWPLLSLPGISAGQRTKRLHGLGGLDIALITASSHPPHLETLAKALESKGLTLRERSRLIFTLAWHGRQEGRQYIPELFRPTSQSTGRSNDALIALVQRLKDPKILRQVLTQEYQKAKTSNRLITQIPFQLIGVDYWGALVTQTLSQQVNNAQAWQDVERLSLSSKVDWLAVLKANQNSPRMPDLIRRLLQHGSRLTPSQCTAYKLSTRLIKETHVRERRVALLHRDGCSTQADLEAAVLNGSPMATLLMGLDSTDPNHFFLKRLTQPDQSTASITAQALLLKPETLEGLKPIETFANALAKHLKPKVQNFYVLRLLQRLIARTTSPIGERLGVGFIRQVAPLAKGQFGAIHTDALLILEHIGNTAALAVIKQTLKALNPGQVRVKLMTRFGYILN